MMKKILQSVWLKILLLLEKLNVKISYKEIMQSDYCNTHAHTHNYILISRGACESSIKSH
jgi:hypothetical protein